MLSNVFLKTLYDMRRPLMWWVLGVFLLSLWYMTFYPTFQESGSDFQEMMDNLPASMKALIGGEVDFTTLEGFLAVEAFSFMYPILLLAFGVSYGSGLIGGEEESGTLEMLLATPISRWRVMLDKFLALVVFTLVVLLAIFLGFVAGGLVAGIEGMDVGNLFRGTFNMLPLALFFTALTMFLTGIRGGRGLALGVVLGLATVTYFIHSMATVADIPAWLQQLSPWYYYNGTEVIKEGANVGHVALLLGLTVALIAGGMWGFQRRDIGT